MAQAKRPPLRDVDKEERVSMRDAAANSEPSTDTSALDLRPGKDFIASDGVPIPSKVDLETPAAATMWAEHQIAQATPRAVQEIISQMRKGDKKERFAAATKLIDLAGIQAKDKNTISAPVIVLTNKVIQNIPWAKKKLEKAERIVDGEIVESSNAKKDGA